LQPEPARCLQGDRVPCLLLASRNCGSRRWIRPSSKVRQDSFSHEQLIGKHTISVAAWLQIRQEEELQRYINRPELKRSLQTIFRFCSGCTTLDVYGGTDDWETILVALLRTSCFENEKWYCLWFEILACMEQSHRLCLAFSSRDHASRVFGAMLSAHGVVGRSGCPSSTADEDLPMS